MIKVLFKLKNKYSEVGMCNLLRELFYRLYNEVRILPIWRFWKFRHSSIVAEDSNEWNAFQYLKAKYSDFLYALPQFEVSKDRAKIIWWSWLQGLADAPELCKACLRSLEENFPDYTINIITEENICDYVNLPDYILDKYKRDIISKAHFSDIFRTALLVRYGGGMD